MYKGQDQEQDQEQHLDPEQQLDFSGEQDALSFAVRCWDGLQLQEVEQHLDLRRGSSHQRCVQANRPGRADLYLSHDLQGPAVPQVEGLCGVGRNLALLLRWPQQRGPEHRGQVVERHLVDVLLLCHPDSSRHVNTLREHAREPARQHAREHAFLLLVEPGWSRTSS